VLSYEFFSHFAVSLIYLTIISLFKIGKFNSLDYFSLWLGGLIGTYLLDIDHLIYCLFFRPEKTSAKKFQALLKEKKYKEALFSLAETHFEHNELIFHNAVFIPIWIILSFFILSSSGSIFASILVMTIYLHLLKDIWDVIRIEKSYNLKFLFWQIKTPIEEKIKRYYVWGITLIFILENFLLFG